VSELQVKWPKIIDCKYLDKPPLIAWINLGNATMFRIIAFFSYGGRLHPREGLFIGIERVGCYFFNISPEISAGYVSEKLGIPSSDAAALADWMNAQLLNNCEQQGEYDRDFILNNELCFYAGERVSAPLVPEIIE